MHVCACVCSIFIYCVQKFILLSWKLLFATTFRHSCTFEISIIYILCDKKQQKKFNSDFFFLFLFYIIQCYFVAFIFTLINFCSSNMMMQQQQQYLHAYLCKTKTFSIVLFRILLLLFLSFFLPFTNIRLLLLHKFMYLSFPFYCASHAYINKHAVCFILLFRKEFFFI